MLISYTFVCASADIEIRNYRNYLNSIQLCWRIFFTFHFIWFCCCCCRRLYKFSLNSIRFVLFSCLIKFTFLCFAYRVSRRFALCWNARTHTHTHSVGTFQLWILPSYVSNYENAKLLKGKWNGIHNFWSYHKRIKRKFWQCNFPSWICVVDSKRMRMLEKPFTIPIRLITFFAIICMA